MAPRRRTQQQRRQPPPPPPPRTAPAPQPDWQAYEQGLQGLSIVGRELSRVPALYEPINDRYNEILEAINAQTAAMNAQFVALNARFDSLERDLRLRDVQAWNATHENLVALMVQDIPIPEGFPSTARALYALVDREINPLSTYYGLSLEGGIGERRNRLARLLGVPLPL